MVVGSLSVKLGLVTIGWDSATAKAKQQAKDLQKSLNDLAGGAKQVGQRLKELGGAFGIGALGMGALIQQTLAFSNEINDLSRGFDISIAKTLQFRDAIATSGGNAEGAAKMMTTLFGKIADAQKGNEATIAQFEQLGISFKELSSMSNEQAITRIFDALANGSDNSYQKVKMLKEMLGKQGVGIAVEEVAEKLHMSMAEYKNYEVSIKRAAEVSDNLKTTLDNLKIAFADMISPFAKGGLVSIDQFKALLIGIGSYVVVGGLMRTLVVLKEFVTLLQTMRTTTAAITAMQGPKGLAQLAAGVIAYNIAMKSFESSNENAPAVGDAELTPEQKKAQQDEANANRVKIQAAESRLNLAKELFDIERKRTANEIASLDTSKWSSDLIEIELKNKEEIAKIEDKRIQSLSKGKELSEAERGAIQATYKLEKEQADIRKDDAIIKLNAERAKEIRMIGEKTKFEKMAYEIQLEQAALDANKYKMNSYEVKMAEETLTSKQKILTLEQQIVDAKNSLGFGGAYEAEAARIRAQIKQEEELSQRRAELMTAEEERRGSFVEGWKQAFREYAYNAKNYAQVGAEAFQTFSTGMSTMIDNFVETGKLKFADFAKSVIKSIMAMILKMQAMQLVMMAIGFFKGKFASPVGSAGGLGATDLAGGSVGYAAAGGEIDGPTIVGENGPEMFIPNKGGGTVIPNNQIGSYGSQPQTVYNGTVIQNMNAIDTQSATQFLIQNKQTIWAANQSAGRSLPMSR